MHRIHFPSICSWLLLRPLGLRAFANTTTQFITADHWCPPADTCTCFSTVGREQSIDLDQTLCFLFCLTASSRTFLVETTVCGRCYGPDRCPPKTDDWQFIFLGFSSCIQLHCRHYPDARAPRRVEEGRSRRKGSQ